MLCDFTSGFCDKIGGYIDMAQNVILYGHAR